MIRSELRSSTKARYISREGAMPVRKALEYSSQIAAGLAAAHDPLVVRRFERLRDLA